MKIEIKPKQAILIAIFLILGLYSLYQARFLILGPRVWIETHKDGDRVGEAVVTVGGGSSNIAWLSFNGRQIFTDEEGRWGEKLIVSSGTSIITVEARDRFGRQTKKSLRLILPE